LIHASFDPSTKGLLIAFHTTGNFDPNALVGKATDGSATNDLSRNLLVVAESAADTLRAFVKPALKKWSEESV
jgi:hypothetical protein